MSASHDIQARTRCPRSPTATSPVPDEVSLAADGYRCIPDDLTNTKE
ncbi:hypothetical protein [Streptomyces sp. NPDC059788]